MDGGELLPSSSSRVLEISLKSLVSTTVLYRDYGNSTRTERE
jgi:hypothetical protein